MRGAVTLNNDVTTNTTGNVYLQSAGAISETGAAKVTAGTLNLNNDVTTNATGNVYLQGQAGITEGGGAKIVSGVLGMSAGGAIAVNTATNDVNTLGAITSAGSITFQDTDDLTLSNVAASGNFPGVTAGLAISGAGDLNITTASTLNLNENITAAATITQAGGAVMVGGTAGTRTVTATNGNVTFANSITSSQPLTINAGAGGSNGLITISNGINSNSNAIILNGTDWSFIGSAAGSINANTSSVTIAHSTNGIINLVASGTGLGTDNLARINTAASGTLYVGDATKGDTVNVGGNVDFAVSTPNAEIRAASLTNSAGRIGTHNTANHLLTISTTTGANTNILGNTGTANVAVHNSGAGNITLNMDTGDLNLTRSGPAGAGTGTAVDTANGTIDLRTQAGTLTVAASGGGLLSTGNIDLHSHGALTINDAVNTSSGNLKLVAGRASGMGGALNGVSLGEGTWGGGTQVVSPMNINGSLRSGYTSMNGNIMLFSSGPILQSSTADAGIQAFHSKPLEEGKLTAITFNNGKQAAPITLENQKKSTANAGSFGNCGSVSGTGNCVGPLILETRMQAGLVPPASPYSESDIKYMSINGTNIFGVGTAAAISFVAPSQTINSSSLNGKDVFFHATAGNVDLNVQISSADINAGLTGGSLNMIAAGNVNLNAPKDSSKSGVSIGKVISVSADGVVTAEKFDHDLKIVATGDVVIKGGVYMTGDLTLRANASMAEVNSTTPNATPQGSGGTGKVVLETQPTSFYTGALATSFPLEVKAKNITIGTKVGGVAQPVAGLVMSAAGPKAITTPGVAQRADAVIEATGALEIYTTGDIELTAGNASATTVGSVLKATAVTALIGETFILKGMGIDGAKNTSNLILKAGTASTNTTGGGGAIASADAFIVAISKKEIDIGGTLMLRGGTTPKTGQSSAVASIDPNELIIRTGGDIVLIAGTGTNSSANILNSGDISLFIGGNGSVLKDITFTTANAGSRTVTVPGGLILVGGAGSGLFGARNVPIGFGDEIKGTFSGGGIFTSIGDSGLSSAFITANAPRSYDGLLSYIIYAANEETRAARTRAGLGASDDSNSPSCN